MAITPECLACGAGLSVEAFCADNPLIPGCGDEAVNEAQQDGMDASLMLPLQPPPLLAPLLQPPPLLPLLPLLGEAPGLEEIQSDLGSLL